MSRTKNSPEIDRLTVCWALLLCFIPLLSVQGRALQAWVIRNLGAPLAGSLIFLSLALVIGVTLRQAQKKGHRVPLAHLVWVLVLFLGAPLLLDRVEERLHFLVFGSFGALSMLVHRPGTALMLCLAVAGGDEILQYFLPDRVGDWRDVVMNGVASIAAAFFIWMIFIRNREPLADV
ncbi:MAG TPA: VanZ family protein [Geopsychrobacteraceae bacterium]|nr:VanZ family protein [Geopsychrobacteraceae bacterium]